MGTLHVIEICTDEFEAETGRYNLTVENNAFSLTPEVIAFCEERNIDIVPCYDSTDFGSSVCADLDALDHMLAAQ
jgi:hypothetical protein